MKTFVIISDTHGNRSALQKLTPIIKENDYLIFLGDGILDVYSYKNLPKEKLITVLGNCDGGSGEEVIEVENVKILITHGHEYGVKNSLQKLFLRAKEVGATVALYGHTHVADIIEHDGVTLINPGTLSRYSAKNSYCYMVVHNKNVTPVIREVTF